MNTALRFAQNCSKMTERREPRVCLIHYVFDESVSRIALASNPRRMDVIIGEALSGGPMMVSAFEVRRSNAFLCRLVLD